MKHNEYIAIALTTAIALPLTGLHLLKPDTKHQSITAAVDFVSGTKPAHAASLSVSSNKQLVLVALTLMQTAAWAEAGWHPGIATDDLYKIQFGMTKFESYASHPDQVMCADTYSGQICSAASGAYQFMPATWDDIYERYDYWPVGPNGETFIPAAQDLGFLRLFAETGGWWHLEAGIKTLNGVVSVDDDAIGAAMNAAAATWCSFPSYTQAARGPANAYSCNDPRQAQKSMEDTIAMFQENLKKNQQ